MATLSAYVLGAGTVRPVVLPVKVTAALADSVAEVMLSCAKGTARRPRRRAPTHYCAAWAGGFSTTDGA